MAGLKTRALEYYEKNETKVDIGFFAAGVLFDVLTLSDIDDPLSILQQVAYLFVIGWILYLDFTVPRGLSKVSPRFEKPWNYRAPILHFFMGSLLSLYSLFFLKSASFFSSFLFLFAMAGLMIANEIKAVQKSQVDLKIGLYFICLFSFFSMIFPVLLGFVGWTPFLLTCVMTSLILYSLYRWLSRKIDQKKDLLRILILPGGSVVALFLVFYLFGLIPPVPLSVEDLGVYHKIEKSDGRYLAWHEKPWWNFWSSGDQDFLAEPGDQVYFFAKIFSPGRFDDQVVLHWQFKDSRVGWSSSDRIPMRVTGGRRQGYRGFAVKQNFSEGDWRVKVETTDGREIGRLSFNVRKSELTNPNRSFTMETF